MFTHNHFLLTRFNCPFHRHPQSRGVLHRKKALSEAYLDKRFQIFEDFCFPSVSGQTNKDFVWIVYFHHKTQEKYRKRIRRMVKAFPAMRPEFVKEFNFGVMRRTMQRNRLRDDYEYTITSRLDNDDAIASTFIEQVQANIPDEECVGLCFRHGYKKMLGRFKEVASNGRNAFLTLFERRPIPEALVVYVTGHGKLQGYLKQRGLRYLVIEDQYMWMKIIHQTNIVNKFGGRSTKLIKDPERIKRLKQEFNFEHALG